VQKLITLTLAVSLLGAGCGRKETPAAAAGTTLPSSGSEQFARASEIIRSSPPREAAAACDQYRVSDLPADLRERCASAHAELARELVDKGDAEGARKALDRARAEGAPSHRLSTVERSLKEEEGKAELTAGMARRDAVASDIRNVFQYRSMEVRVATSGQYKQTITIEYPSFDGEYAAQIKSDSYVMGPLRDAGFKEVNISDGASFYTSWRVE